MTCVFPSPRVDFHTSHLPLSQWQCRSRLVLGGYSSSALSTRTLELSCTSFCFPGQHFVPSLSDFLFSFAGLLLLNMVNSTSVPPPGEFHSSQSCVHRPFVSTSPVELQEWICCGQLMLWEFLFTSWRFLELRASAAARF